MPPHVIFNHATKGALDSHVWTLELLNTKRLVNILDKSIFLVIFQNKITTPLTPSTSEREQVGLVMFFILEVSDFKVAMLSYIIYLYINIRIRTHNTDCSFEPIFMKFTWLVRVHLRVNLIVFGNSQPNRTTDMEVSQMVLDFLRKKT